MPDPSLDDLINQPDTEDDALTWLLTQLASLGFPATSWQSGGITYTTLRLVARVYAKFTGVARDIAKGVLLKLSRGDWLDALLDWYDLARFEATVAVGTVRLDVVDGAGPYTLVPSQLYLAEAVTGRRYLSSNATPVVLPAGPSSTVVPFTAESPGAAYSVPLGTGLTLVTPLPGVTATLVDTTSSGTWLTTLGTDAEADAAAQQRARARWATVGLLKTADAYLFLATNTPGVSVAPTKVHVDGSNPRGPGTLDVWFAGPTGPLGSADATLVHDYLVSLASPNTDLHAANASSLVVTVAATVYVFGGFDQAIAQATSALVALLDATPIGGTVQLSDVIKAVVDVDGVDKVAVPSVLINGAAADLALGVNQLAVNGAHALAKVTV